MFTAVAALRILSSDSFAAASPGRPEERVYYLLAFAAIAAFGVPMRLWTLVTIPT